uniref:Uncharacterized protein n=1 Tax=Geospiza parvula TaxID=87175 RepID=A0A8C3NK90_GEOPR
HPGGVQVSLCPASAWRWALVAGADSPTLALAGWCPLSPTGAQTTQLLVEPPWRPAVLWDRVTLTCQGSGTAGATTWYKDGQRWEQEGGNHFTVTESGTYTCDRPGSGLSRPVNVSDGEDQLVLQVPVRALLEGETLTLRCRYRRDKSVDSVFFYHEETELGGLHNGTELSLSPLQLNHSGRYRCKAWVNNRVSRGWEESAPVTVTVHGEHLTSRHPDIPCHTSCTQVTPWPCAAQCRWAQPLSPSPGCTMGRRWPRVPSCNSGPLMSDTQAPTSAWPPTSWMGTRHSAQSWPWRWTRARGTQGYR